MSESSNEPAGPGKSARVDSDSFRLLVEGVVDYAICMLDAQGNVTSWNPGAERIKGYRADEIIGRHFSVFFPEADIHAGKPQREIDAARHDGRFEEESWRVRKNGERFWANVVVTKLVDAEGTVLGFAKVTRDLTERRRLEEERLTRARAEADAERSFRWLLESVTDYAIYILTPVGDVSSWNVGAERIKGYRAEEIVGQNFARFFPEEDVREGRPQRELESAFRDGRFEEEAWRVRKDGSRFWANVILTRLLDRDGKHIGFAKVTRDLTERRRFDDERIARARAETELNEQRSRDELREQLIGVVGHDLRGPLQSIVMATNVMLKRGVLSEVDTKTTALIARNADRMARMVAQLLDFTRARLGGGIPLELRPIALTELCAEIIDETEAAHPNRALSFEGDRATIGSWDRDRLAQVVANLIGNAIQHGDPDASVSVRVLNDGPERVILRVHNGGMIPTDALATLFDPFRQGLNVQSRKKSDSLGLGLYIAREIVHAHNGTIEVSSSASAGTTFTVTLPRAPFVPR